MPKLKNLIFLMARTVGVVAALMILLGLLWFSGASDPLDVTIGIGSGLTLAAGSLVSTSALKNSHIGAMALFVCVLAFGGANAGLNLSHWSWFEHAEDRSALMLRTIILSTIVCGVAIRVFMESRNNTV